MSFTWNDPTSVVGSPVPPSVGPPLLLLDPLPLLDVVSPPPLEEHPAANSPPSATNIDASNGAFRPNQNAEGKSLAAAGGSASLRFATPSPVPASRLIEFNVLFISIPLSSLLRLRLDSVCVVDWTSNWPNNIVIMSSQFLAPVPLARSQSNPSHFFDRFWKPPILCRVHVTKRHLAARTAPRCADALAWSIAAQYRVEGLETATSGAVHRLRKLHSRTCTRLLKLQFRGSIAHGMLAS